MLVSGAATAADDPSIVGRWSPVQRWVEPITHAMLLPTGKVMWWTEQGADEIHLWDPVTGAHSALPHPGFNPFCAGHAFLEDGRVLVAGGQIDGHHGEPKASIYDPLANTWSRLPDMKGGRWYPTATTLPDGDVLVISGFDIGELNLLPQIWDVQSGTWRDLTGATLSVDAYPWMFVLSNGKVFCAGPEATTRVLDTKGAGAWTTVGETVDGSRRKAGSAVMYEAGKILITGGGDPPTDTAEVIDLTGPSPQWRQVGRMIKPRKQHNMTLLPDGTVLVTGGSCGAGKSNAGCAVLEAELWDPRTETFTVVARAAVFRGYHSTALLLPDGRVLTGGGVKTGSIEIYSPPYLFKGPRPELTEVPDSLQYNQTFTLATPQASSIAKVALIRLAAVTHAFDQSQRIHFLSFTARPGAIEVTAPASSAACPPGPHLLFIVDKQGVPSEGRFVRIGGTPVEPGPRIVVLSPNGAERLRAAQTVEIRWSTQGVVPAVTLEYSADGGSNWELIERDVENEGRYSWLVPSIESDRVLVRISSQTQAGSRWDTSDDVFAVRLGECEPCGANEPCAAGFQCIAGTCHRTCAGNCSCAIASLGSVCACSSDMATEGNACGRDGGVPICAAGLECRDGTCQAPFAAAPPTGAETTPPELKRADDAMGPIYRKGCSSAAALSLLLLTLVGMTRRVK